MNDFFHRFAQKISEAAGSPLAFILAVASIGVWAASGPVFDFSDTWQLVINTATTIVTFLMVFLIQNAQNRDAQAIHLKLDELIRSKEGARNTMVDLEDLSEDELKKLQRGFQKLASRGGGKLKNPPTSASGSRPRSAKYKGNTALNNAPKPADQPRR